MQYDPLGFLEMLCRDLKTLKLLFRVSWFSFQEFLSMPQWSHAVYLILLLKDYFHTSWTRSGWRFLKRFWDCGRFHNISKILLKIFIWEKRTDLLIKNLNCSVLLADSNVVKISDFGTCRTWNDISVEMSFIGTYAWMAPEVIRKELCSEKVDVW